MRYAPGSKTRPPRAVVLTRPRQAAVLAWTFALALCALAAANAQSDDAILAGAVSPRERYTALTRYNLSRYEDGRYVGHVYREVRGTLRRVPSAAASEYQYSGTFYVFEETKRENRNVAQRVNRSVPVSLELNPSGQARVPEDQPFPLRRGFPQFPPEPVSVGERWEAPGELVVDPRWSGEYTRIGILAAYRYEGTEHYQGREVHRITARYATRYREGQDPSGDPDLSRVSGSHLSTILVATDNLRPVLVRDRIEEEYRYADGSALRFKGFALTFYSTPPALNRTEVAGELQKRLEEEQVEDVEVSEDSEGVRLSLKDIRFVADEATILPQERGRLDGIARALASVPERTFLVVGHTADIGRPVAQQELSVRRAKTVVEELTRRGIDPDRLLFEGRGGTEPVAPNDTEEGRARNRRVEILVLE